MAGMTRMTRMSGWRWVAEGGVGDGDGDEADTQAAGDVRKVHEKPCACHEIVTKSGLFAGRNCFPCDLREGLSLRLVRRCERCFDGSAGPSTESREAKGSKCRRSRATERGSARHGRSPARTASSTRTSSARSSSTSPARPSVRARPSCARHSNSGSSSARSAVRGPRGHFPRRRSRRRSTRSRVRSGAGRTAHVAVSVVE